MGIRKSIKEVISECAEGDISHNTAVLIIADLVNTPKPTKPEPSRAALAEEAISDTESNNVVLKLTVTCNDDDSISIDIQHGILTSPDIVRMAVKALQEFGLFKHNIDPLVVTHDEIEELLNKFVKP